MANVKTKKVQKNARSWRRSRNAKRRKYGKNAYKLVTNAQVPKLVIKLNLPTKSWFNKNLTNLHYQPKHFKVPLNSRLSYNDTSDG